MQQAETSVRKILLKNLSWFMASLAVAVLVWFIATAQTDPIPEWLVTSRVPIRAEPDEGLLITNEDAVGRTARVFARGPESVRQLLAPDDIIIRADLTGLRSGTHVVELEWEIAAERDATIVDISPRQLTVQLEEELSILAPVNVILTGEPARGFAVLDTPVPDINQVTVSGAASQVQQVAEVRAEIDVDEQDNPFEDDVRPVPVDADGNPVNNVTVDIQIIRVNVDIGLDSAGTP